MSCENNETNPVACGSIIEVATGMVRATLYEKLPAELSSPPSCPNCEVSAEPCVTSEMMLQAWLCTRCRWVGGKLP